MLRISTLLLVVACSTVSLSQSATPRRVAILGGFSAAHASGRDVGSHDPRTGVTGGVAFIAPISPVLALHAEASATMRGYVVSISDNGTTGTGRLKMNYLDFPILLRLDVPVSGGGVRPFFYAGPTLGFQLGCDIEVTTSGTTIGWTCHNFDQQVGSGNLKVHTTEFGAIVGGGLAFDVGGRTMTMGARYLMGLQEVFSDSDERGRVLSFLISYEWPLGKR